MKFCRIKIDSFDIEKILSKEDLSKFVKMHFKKGEIFYPEEKTKLLIFKEGEAKVSFLYEDKEFILYFLSKNNIYVMHPESIIEFLSDSVVLSLDVTKHPAVFDNPMFCNSVLNSFRNIMMVEKDIIKGLVFENCKRRIISFLLEIAKKSGKKTDEGIEIDLSLSIKDLATFIGSQRQTTSKFFNQLIKEKILKKIGKDKYIIIDMKKLKNYLQ
ncbi:Crp/Fnr family transcriptional regulator [Lebetimonas sp. JH292]|uniref:Crp/Fnr family transcriptional regulator n=1 Tax=Lebetimonas sp. JH292 TaxID=990068 RepID=UPI0004676722|nr:Crp/Fnr family transcriptional regulator [Lebetimonas sp. JH292]